MTNSVKNIIKVGQKFECEHHYLPDNYKHKTISKNKETLTVVKVTKGYFPFTLDIEAVADNGITYVAKYIRATTTNFIGFYPNTVGRNTRWFRLDTSLILQ